jgi:hypothetical protein
LLVKLKSYGWALAMHRILILPDTDIRPDFQHNIQVTSKNMN